MLKGEDVILDEIYTHTARARATDIHIHMFAHIHTCIYALTLIYTHARTYTNAHTHNIVA